LLRLGRDLLSHDTPLSYGAFLLNIAVATP
jgi:hypothetical protein